MGLVSDAFILLYIIILIYHYWKDRKTNWMEEAKKEWYRDSAVRQFTPSNNKTYDKYRYSNWEDLPDEYKELLELRERNKLYRDNIPIFILTICFILKIISLFI